jgi:hypothetical protein
MPGRSTGVWVEFASSVTKRCRTPVNTRRGQGGTLGVTAVRRGGKQSQGHHDTGDEPAHSFPSRAPIRPPPEH